MGTFSRTVMIRVRFIGTAATRRATIRTCRFVLAGGCRWYRIADLIAMRSMVGTQFDHGAPIRQSIRSGLMHREDLPRPSPPYGMAMPPVSAAQWNGPPGLSYNEPAIVVDPLPGSSMVSEIANRDPSLATRAIGPNRAHVRPNG